MSNEGSNDNFLDLIRAIAIGYKTGSVIRRDALKSLFRLGLSAQGAYVALGILPGEFVMAQSRSTPSQVQPPQGAPSSIADPEMYVAQQSKLLAEIAASPTVQHKLKALQSAPEASKPKLAVDLMETIRALPELQNNSTNALRLSLRVFEKEHRPKSGAMLEEGLASVGLGQRSVAFGELSKEGIVTAPTLGELNQKLQDAGVGRSVGTFDAPPGASHAAVVKPIPGLIPPDAKMRPPARPGSPLPKYANIKDLIPKRPIDPDATTVCGSLGYLACVSVGG